MPMVRFFFWSTQQLRRMECRNFTSAAAPLRPLFTGAIFPFDATCSPGNVSQWGQQLVVYSATIGDVLIGKWNAWISVPFPLRFPIGQESTPPGTLSGVYQDSGGDIFPRSLHLALFEIPIPLIAGLLPRIPEMARGAMLPIAKFNCAIPPIGYHVCWFRGPFWTS